MLLTSSEMETVPTVAFNFCQVFVSSTSLYEERDTAKKSKAKKNKTTNRTVLSKKVFIRLLGQRVMEVSREMTPGRQVPCAHCNDALRLVHGYSNAMQLPALPLLGGFRRQISPQRRRSAIES
ncbi:hypothetical protein D3C77_520460 [compost metagenome]